MKTVASGCREVVCRPLKPLYSTHSVPSPSSGRDPADAIDAIGRRRIRRCHDSANPAPLRVEGQCDLLVSKQFFARWVLASSRATRCGTPRDRPRAGGAKLVAIYAN
jgi:hypothetical protein